jgi:hypothetical protein
MKVSPLSSIGQFNPNSMPIHSCSTFTSHSFRTKQRNIAYPFSFVEESLFSSSPTANDPPSWIEPPEQEVQWNYFPDEETLTETNDNKDFSELNDEEDPSPPNSASGIDRLRLTPLYNVSFFNPTEDSWITSLIYGYRWW